MVKVSTLEDVSILVEKSRAKAKVLSPLAQERATQKAVFGDLIAKLTDDSKAFQVELEPMERFLTVKQRLLRAAKDAGVEVAIRKHGNGLAVGLLTPERRSRRGRPRSA